MINEGGGGLYTAEDASMNGRLFEVVPERVLVMKCLGPPEAKDWYQLSFQVNARGCVGGRRQQLQSDEKNQTSKDLVVFRDSTVSRQHFEINLVAPGQYSIRDIGSVGGTFIRIIFGQRKELLPGMIVMLGKHQFTVSSIDTSLISDQTKALEDGELQIAELVADAESLASQLAHVSHSHAEEAADIERRLKFLTSRLTSRLNSGDQFPSATAVVKAESKEIVEVHRITEMRAYDDDKKSANEVVEGNVDCSVDARLLNGTKHCTLTCCAPEGSPLVGRSFMIKSDGATLGRRSTNKIALCVLGDDGVVDTAVSAEHAKIEMDHAGRFYISDGTATKPSTNGTWLRLSGPSQESPPCRLSPGMEVLIGTVRFQVDTCMTIFEQTINDAARF